MKKILLILFAGIIPVLSFSQATPLSTINSWFETLDKPTQAQFQTAWANSYNAVSDGMWDLTGYPSIGFTPYNTMRVGKFFQYPSYPTDTTVSLGFDGIFKVSKLYVNGELVNAGGGGSYLVRDGGTTLHPIVLSDRMAIGTTSASTYNLWVEGTTRSTGGVTTNILTLENTLGNTGNLSISSTGDLQLSDTYNSTPVSLSTMIGSTAWNKTLKTIYPDLGDTVLVGNLVNYAVRDSSFNVYGSSYFSRGAKFADKIWATGVIQTSTYVQTPSVNFAYGAYTGRIDLYNATGKMKLYDTEIPSGITLNELKLGLFAKTGSLISPISASDNFVIGALTANSTYDLTVAGQTNLVGQVNLGNGINIATGNKIQFPNASVTSGPLGLTFNDNINGNVTLSSLVGVASDSVSTSKLNADTLYFNGTYGKKFYSPHTNDLYFTSNGSTFRFHDFSASGGHYSVFYTDALKLTALPTSVESDGGWETQGRFYLNTTDTTFKYATGKTGEWRTLASEEWVTNALSGLSGVSISLDTLFFNSKVDYFTSAGSHSIFFDTKSPGGNALRISAGTSPNLSANSNSIAFTSSNIQFIRGTDTYMFDGITWRNATDTLATKAYARASGGGGGVGTPGGANTSIQYNNSSSLGGFWSYDGTNVVPTTATGIAWSANSFIKGFSADSVAIGKAIDITNNYTSETAVKYNGKSFLDYDGGYLDAYSKTYINYADANANSSNAYGISSTLYTNKNFASTGNTSYSNAGRFVLQNRGTTQIGGASAGTVYLNAVYGEVAGTIDSTSTPGTYKLAAIYGKNSNVGNAKTWAGLFEGNVRISGYFEDNVLKTASAMTGGKWYPGTTYPTDATRLNFDGDLYSHGVYVGTSANDYIALIAGNAFQLFSNGTTRMFFQPTVSDGASSIVYLFDTRNSLTTNGALLASFKNAGVTKASIDKDGNAYFNGITIGNQSVTPGIYIETGASATGSSNVFGISGGIYNTTSVVGRNGNFFGHVATLAATNAYTSFKFERNFTATSYNVSGPVFNVSDVSTRTSGTNSAALFTGTTVAGTRITMNPRIANGSSAVAYSFATDNGMTGSARVFEIKNNAVDEFYVKNDTSVAVTNLKFRGDLYSWKYRALTDTFALVLYPGGKMDTASLYYAAKGWTDDLEDFDTFYAKSYELKALPLPFPNGKEARKPNPVYSSFQFEYELERLTRYLHESRETIKELNARISQLEGKKEE